MSIIKLLSLFFKLNIFKSIYLNFNYLPFRQACCFPIWVYRKTSLCKVKGKIIINAPVRIGMLKIGPHGLGTQDILYSRTIWDVAGVLTINGKICLGRGTKISISAHGNVVLGNLFSISGGSSIICSKKIIFGDNCLLSWDILIMDTDFHYILDSSGLIVNEPSPIEIGNNVWIGCRSTILKGCKISSGNIIAANSTISKSFLSENCIVGGHGKDCMIIKKDIHWKR